MTLSKKEKEEKTVEMPNEEKEITEEEETLEESSKKAHRKKIEKLEKEIEALNAEVKHWKNEYYRAYADTKNLRNSIEKDYQNALKYRAEGFIDNLLPILDTFYLVLQNEPQDEATKNYLVGFQFLYKNFEKALEDEGLSQILPKAGDKFDPKIMEAMDTIESDEEENIIIEVKRKGYKMHDRLLRPAGVVVTIKKQNKEEPKEMA